jgi:4-hydroxy-2-oxoheptanedioate aldolase
MPRLLDHGASGIVIAMASSVELVKEAVRRARYQPEGVRSYGGQRYGLRAAPTDPSQIRPYIYPMIEDSRGYQDIAKIARVKGIAGLHIGPVDLGLGLGIDRGDRRFAEAIKKIISSGHAAKVPVTMHAVRADEAAGWVEAGVDEVVLTADIELIRSAFQSQVERARLA